VLADALKPAAAKITWAFVYGSIASGHEQSDSDIDLMIIGKGIARRSSVAVARRSGAAWPRDKSNRLCAAEFAKKIGGQRSLSRAGVRQAQTQCAR